jgi:hypothetical protein
MLENVTPAVHVIQAFLDAYNARDIETFIGQLADDVTIEDDSAATLHGANAARALYAELFERDTAQKSTLIGRLILGDYVIDKEYITGRRAEPFSTIAIYKVRAGKIVYMRLLRETANDDPFGLETSKDW